MLPPAGVASRLLTRPPAAPARVMLAVAVAETAALRLAALGGKAERGGQSWRVTA